jgi:hypothetical protein
MSDNVSQCINPFKFIKITPTYGFCNVQINWETESAFKNSTLYSVNVWKSRDGYTDWFKLNNALYVDPDTGMLNDTDFKPNSQLFNWHYKLEIVSVKTGKSVAMSSSVGIYDTLTSGDYATLKSMITNELLTADNSIVYLLRPKGLVGKDIMNNDPTPNTDYLSGIQIGVANDTLSRGYTYIPGFSNPIKMQIIVDGFQTRWVDNAQTGTTVERKVLTFTGYAFPKPVRGDIIVFPETDDRYAFDNFSQEFYFKGTIPFKYQGTATLLPRNESAYKFDLRNITECAV